MRLARILWLTVLVLLPMIVPARAQLQGLGAEQQAGGQPATAELLANLEHQLSDRTARIDRRVAQIRILLGALIALVPIGIAGSLMLHRRRVVVATGEPVLNAILRQQSDLRYRQAELTKTLSRFEIATTAWCDDLARFEKDRTNLHRLIEGCRAQLDDMERRLIATDDDIGRRAKFDPG